MILLYKKVWTVPRAWRKSFANNLRTGLFRTVCPPCIPAVSYTHLDVYKRQGQTFEGVEAAVTEHFTSPPKPYTEDTLLSAMENAGKEDIPDEAERKGLGTPATRAAIIEKLVAAGFVERKGKNLIPTKAGINLVTILPEPLTSPMLTAEWEQKLTEVAKGSANPVSYTHLDVYKRQLLLPETAYPGSQN